MRFGWNDRFVPPNVQLKLFSQTWGEHGSLSRAPSVIGICFEPPPPHLRKALPGHRCLRCLWRLHCSFSKLYIPPLPGQAGWKTNMISLLLPPLAYFDRSSCFPSNEGQADTESKPIGINFSVPLSLQLKKINADVWGWQESGEGGRSGRWPPFHLNTTPAKIRFAVWTEDL